MILHDFLLHCLLGEVISSVTEYETGALLVTPERRKETEEVELFLDIFLLLCKKLF
jgi:hypothetical protein